MDGVDDWEWLDDDGHLLISIGPEVFYLTAFRWVPKVRVPYKHNKRKYGR